MMIVLKSLMGIVGMDTYDFVCISLNSTCYSGKLEEICNVTRCMIPFSRWWFQAFFIFSPTWGRFPILTNIFQMG